MLRLVDNRMGLGRGRTEAGDHAEATIIIQASSLGMWVVGNG